MHVFIVLIVIATAQNGEIIVTRSIRPMACYILLTLAHHMHKSSYFILNVHVEGDS